MAHLSAVPSRCDLAWLDDVRNRIAISEGRRARVYLDNNGVKTIGIGFNIERGDARQALARSGVSAIDGVLSGAASLTSDQIDALFSYSFQNVVSSARASLAPGVFDSMTDPRRFVICDLVFQLGEDGWLQFQQTRSILNAAQLLKNDGKDDGAHNAFMAAGDHLEQSAWFSQSGDRSRRDVSMVRYGEWADPYGNGQ